MRKRKYLLASVLLALSLSACGTKQPQNAGSGETESEPAETSAAADSGVLVVYFSATGTTQGVAEKIAALEGGTLYEIVPAEPYSEADRDWHDSGSRTTIEQNDLSARPEIKGELPSLEGIETVYLGYPIWWGQAPRILDTFVERVNFDGRTVIPFCTSASSPIGESGVNLGKTSGSGTWLEGTRFSGSSTEAQLKEWIDGLRNDAEEKGNETMRMKIDATEVDVTWEDNPSVKELRELAETGLTIPMSMYGGFEQVGPIGAELTSDDSEITTAPGEIVLYSGNQIVVFYGSNSWAYTRLGRIGCDEEELKKLLGNGDVTITLEKEKK